MMVLKNYLKSVPEPDIKIVTLKCDAAGLIDVEDLKSKISQDVCAVMIENPTYLGSVEVKAEEIGKIAREAGAEYIVYTDPISLGVMEAPANYGATITCGDFHTLGCAYGSRRMPGRLHCHL
jgi:glycine dehydrogenase subunit 1